MKKYINPEMKFFVVSDEDVLTLSCSDANGRAVQVGYNELFPSSN